MRDDWPHGGGYSFGAIDREKTYFALRANFGGNSQRSLPFSVSGSMSTNATPALDILRKPPVNAEITLGKVRLVADQHQNF